LTRIRSARLSTFAALGGGSKVCELVPSGTRPSMMTRSPPTAAVIEVIGATVVTTRSRSPSALAPEPPPHAAAASRPATATAEPASRLTVRAWA
jgi:hypothetical protein